MSKVENADVPCEQISRLVMLLSVIREMTRVARQHDAINLSQGFPDFDPPAELPAAGSREMINGDHHQCAVAWGAPAFRQALAEKQSRLMGLEIDPDAHVVATVRRHVGHARGADDRVQAAGAGGSGI